MNGRYDGGPLIRLGQALMLAYFVAIVLVALEIIP